MFIFERTMPRWLIFLFDLAICGISLSLAYLLRFNFSDIPETELRAFPMVYSWVIVIRALSFYYSKIFKGIIRYTSSKDIQRILIITTLGSLILAVSNIINFYFAYGFFIVPFSIVIIEYMATTFLMVSTRLIAKSLYFEYKSPSRLKRSVIIFGAGEAGIITKRTIDRDAGSKYKVLAFIDDDPRKKNKKLEGVTIYPLQALGNLLKENDVAHLIISVQNMESARKQEIVEICLKHKTKVLNVPPANSWINGELSFKQIKKVRIEDLLERDPIVLNEKNIQREFSGKMVLVTGAAGSIGSELVRQLIKFQPSGIVLVDQNESPLYDMELELKEKFKGVNFEIVVGDIRNKERMTHVFRSFKPQVVFHAAAYKHVPIMEENPSEAIRTNVYGTQVLADLSAGSGVQNFVMISTDKAVNPTNIMGASKRIAEIYIQSLGKTNGTKFITTRFGNVLGSNGSVIPRFRQQIENGGPVTITDPEITRFFMTIPEACRLVLEASAMGKGGEIFVFDMGKPVKIIDLAKKMIQLSGLELNKDIQIVQIGLRPGEKLYEELLSDQENTLPTHHRSILIAKVKEYDFNTVKKETDELVNMFALQDNMSIVKKMKEIVPEFISNNSVYEKLDVINKQ